MRNKIFIFFSLIVFGSFVYLLIGIIAYLELKKNENNLFKNRESLIFHKKYSKRLHHLRDSNRWGKEKNDYLFSNIKKYKNSNLILLQGDSWVEQSQEIGGSLKLLENFSRKNNISIINAGITSYSPSLMNIQFNLLKKNFNLKPSIVVAYIDQTDIGDEICRYNPSKILNDNNELIGVKYEEYTSKIYDYTKIYNYSNIKLNSNFPVKFFKLANFKIKYFLLRTTKRFKEISEVGWSQRGNVKCRFKEIQKYLFNLDQKSKNLFLNSLNEYLKILEEDIEIKKILLVSFPHYKHQIKEYKINVSNLIDELIENNNFSKISHLNFNNYDFSKLEIKKIYLDGDPSSHLNEKFHTELFIKNILNELQRKLR